MVREVEDERESLVDRLQFGEAEVADLFPESFLWIDGTEGVGDPGARVVEPRRLDDDGVTVALLLACAG